MAPSGSRCDAHPVQAWVHTKPPKRITGRKLQAMRQALFAAEPLCADCKRNGRVSLAVIRDHIKSLGEGGEDVETNVQGLCTACHDEKTAAESARARHPSAYQGGRSKV